MKTLISAIQHAFELGVTFFDTAGVYGCGHSERVLGQALAPFRDRVVIATKFGQVFDEETRQVRGYNTTPEQVRRDCEDSLRRLNTDYIDLFQCHVKDLDHDQALSVRDTLEQLVQEGKIKFYGWSTDDPGALTSGSLRVRIAQPFNSSSTCSMGTSKRLRFANNSTWPASTADPLNMGLLTGKFSRDTENPCR